MAIASEARPAMETLTLRQVVEKDGEVHVTGLPTARDLLASGLVGLWADRADLGDSVDFARKLRTEALRPPR